GTVLWIGDVRRAEDAIAEAMINHPPQLVDAVTLTKANLALDAVEKSLDENDRAGAIQRFTRIAPEAKKDRDFARRFASVSEKVSAAADALLAEIDPLIDAKQFPQAAAKLNQLAALFKGLPQETTARQKLAAMQADPQAKAVLDADRAATEAATALAVARRLRHTAS